MALSRNELVRYSRQLVIPELGPAGQEKLKAAKVAVIGAGGLGALVLEYLAGAGVGELGVFDFGPVELSNLHRQFLYGTGDIGGVKTELAKRRLLEINPEVTVNAHEGMLTAENTRGAIERYDYIADCTDNFMTRSAINKACLALGKTYVHGAVYQFEGQLAVFDPCVGPCLGCLCPDAESMENQACAEAGVMGPAAGAVASMQALEVLKLILGFETLKGKFAMLDFRSSDFNVIELKKREDCPVCGARMRLDKKFINSLAVELITPEELKARLDCAGLPRVLDLRYAWEHDLCHIKGDTWVDFDELVKNGAGFQPDDDLVFYCKGQSKSAKAFRVLREKGFKNICVLKGGVDAWAEKIEKGMTRY
ncbi:MAG: molybdenum cofactor biosynthesis protein MoeB [Elusimicrobia bacterium CG08_land_8_20_14_0_20_59_10]|nr:MAG: molybdenum cofactor biosynthesis protein MoeB [Elusimicrobia bacterium CG08_land_8_20_14_0_20_59_10]